MSNDNIISDVYIGTIREEVIIYNDFIFDSFIGINFLSDANILEKVTETVTI